MNLLQRLSEPSTWAGLGLVVQSLAHAYASGDYSGAIAGIVGGLAAVLVPEKRA